LFCFCLSVRKERKRPLHWVGGYQLALPSHLGFHKPQSNEAINNNLWPLKVYRKRSEKFPSGKSKYKLTKTLLLKLFAGQRADLLMSLFYYNLTLDNFFPSKLKSNLWFGCVGRCGTEELQFKTRSLWSVREMVPSRSSTHICSGVINCPPKRKCCITLATVFPTRERYAE